MYLWIICSIDTGMVFSCAFRTFGRRFASTSNMIASQTNETILLQKLLSFWKVGQKL